MLRRSFATLILTVSLLVGSLAWSGFLALRTVLDAGRSEDVAQSLYDDEPVRDQLADNIAAALGAAVPVGTPISQDEIDVASRAALASPTVELLVVDAFVATHKAFLGDGEPPDRLDAGAFGTAARDALVAQRPDLAAVLPPSPELVVPLPTEQIPDAGFVRDALERVVPILALIAVAGSLFALIATSDRPAVLRRAGFWAIGVSAFVLLFAYGVPWLGEQFAPDQSAVIAALVGALATTTRGPAVAMAAAGAAGVVAAMMWSRAPRRTRTPAVTYAPAVAPPSIPTEPHRLRRGGRAVRRDMPTGPSLPRPAPPAGPPVSQRPAVAQPVVPPPAATPSDPRWVEGHGWVLDPAGVDIPPDARWVPGVGYVTDHPPPR